MKKNKKPHVIFIAMILTCTFAFMGCQNNQSSATDSTAASGSSSESSSEVTAAELMIFTREELTKYTGKDGTRAYIAIDGKVYDVTDVPQWKDGGHVGGKFEAGKDFTDELKNLAPHGASKMDGVPIVGTLTD